MIKQYLSPEDVEGFLLWSVSKLWLQKRQQSLKQLGLSHIEFVLLGHLLWLSKKEAYVTQQMLSDWLYVDKVTISTNIPSLEKKKLIEKKVHPKDKRAYYLTVTKKGEEIAKTGLRAAKETNQEFFKPLGDRREELASLLKVLLHTHKTNTFV